MRRPGQRWISSLVLFAVLLLILFPSRAVSVEACFHSGGHIFWPVTYQDSFFAKAGGSYHHGTALASLGLALSAFRAHDQDLQNKGSNVRHFMESLGFSDISLTQYDILPSIKTIATAKTILGQEGEHHLVAVAVSGRGYQDEWKSNFSIGTGLHHEGFDQAARQVVDRLIAYLKAHGLNAPRVWITGYSRAAATANRAAALLLDQQIVKARDLFCYTFATPNNTRQQNAAAYSSIFNVVGAFDPVPMVPFSDWGFARYGQTFFLPAPEINSDYPERSRPVKGVYSRMTGSKLVFNSSSNAMLQKVLGVMSESVPDTKSYQSNLQNYLEILWTNRKSPWSALVSTAKEALKTPGFRATMKDIGGKMLSIFSSLTMEA